MGLSVRKPQSQLAPATPTIHIAALMILYIEADMLGWRAFKTHQKDGM